MKNTSIKIILMIGFLSTVIACTPTSVIPHTGGMFTVIATAPSEKQAGELVAAKAQGMCEQQNAAVKVLDQEAIYQGIDKNQQKLIKLAHDILPSSKTSGPYTPEDHEYKSKLTFKCE